MANNLLKTLGIVGALTVATLGSGCSRSPMELKNVKLSGTSYVDEPHITCFFDDSHGNRTPVRNEDKTFDQANAYDNNLQARYNVSGYKTFLGTKVATRIVPYK